jgi:ketosteroid isomerase-like protein
VTLAEIVRWFEHLTRESVADIGRYYAPDAFFKDPFNEVAGVDAVRRVFAHMFDQADEPRFRVLERWQEAHGAMLTW